MQIELYPRHEKERLLRDLQVGQGVAGALLWLGQGSKRSSPADRPCTQCKSSTAVSMKYMWRVHMLIFGVLY